MTDKARSNPWSEKDQAINLTQVALKYYAVHKNVVLRKLQLTQIATQKHDKQRTLNGASSTVERLKIKLFYKTPTTNNLWHNIIELFSSRMIYEEDLLYIEELLSSIPKEINKRRQELESKDKTLNNLLQNLDTDEYQKAKKKIKSVQRHKNPLTGLTPDQYEINLLRQLKSILFSSD
jgi:archaellum component FlaC